MTSYSALAPVSLAVYTTLNIPAITDLAPGGVSDVVPQGTPYPLVLFEVSDAQQWGGFGTKPGRGQFPEMRLRVHVYSQDRSVSSAQAIVEQVIAALADPPPVAAYASWAIFHDQTIDLGDQTVANIVVHELVADFRLYVEQIG